MKKLSLLFIAIALFFSVKAQCPLTEAVDFSGTDIHGEDINLFEILDAGQYVLIDFFYTTCGPCNTVAPYMQEAYESFGCNDFDVFFMSIATGDNNAACIAFDELHGIEFPCLSGVEGGGTAINTTYGIPAYPTIILIAPDHSIVIQDLWPISNAQTVIGQLEANGVTQNDCVTGPMASFSSDISEVCALGSVQFNNTSTSGVTSWSWEFEGGDPATSTDENPVVEYATAGDFNVSLTVSDGTTSNTNLIEDYITVNELPEVTFEELPQMCVNYGPYELVEGSPAGGTYSGDFVTGGSFAPADAGIGTHTVLYTYTDATGCENSEEREVEVDACVGIETLIENDITISPNPATNLVMIEANEMVELSIFSIDGQIMFNTTATEKVEIATSEWNSGIYLVQIKTGNGVKTSRLVIK